ncbi:hypothetical protein [Ectobacillus panaciterrae]|uniref:hypothetical protein n=1 Tax=Ectobacillus panaciterrae TaxID=363872 RepID=UPI0004148B77|nr:hypothetical protein [Ectobacillus panaciterrae]
MSLRRITEWLLLEQAAHRPIYEALLFVEHANAQRIEEKQETKIAQTKLYLSAMEMVYEKKYKEETLATSY